MPLDKDQTLITSEFAGRVYLQRVRLFFGHAIGNISNSIVGALLIAIVLNIANVPISKITVWFIFISFCCIAILYIEYRFKQIRLNIKNANKWLLLRASSGILLVASYGISPFLFSQSVSIVQEMFLFIVISAAVSIGSIAYITMPYYYLSLNMVSMFPLTIYLLNKHDQMHLILAMTAIIWQLTVLSKAWKVTQDTIQSIFAYEQLQDEIRHHKDTKKQLHKLATHDALTGLANRRLITTYLDTMLASAHHYEQRVIVMFINLDSFKSINDNYGHDAGDLLLKEISARLKLHIRKTDTIARMGGDEFILGFAEMENRQVFDIELLAQRILASISAPILLPDGHTVSVQSSIGIALYPDNGSNANNLIKAADDAMYSVKANGKNNFAYAQKVYQ